MTVSEHHSAEHSPLKVVQIYSFASTISPFKLGREKIEGETTNKIERKERTREFISSRIVFSTSIKQKKPLK